MDSALTIAIYVGCLFSTSHEVIMRPLSTKKGSDDIYFGCFASGSLVGGFCSADGLRLTILANSSSLQNLVVSWRFSNDAVADNKEAPTAAESDVDVSICGPIHDVWIEGNDASAA